MCRLKGVAIVASDVAKSTMKVMSGTDGGGGAPREQVGCMESVSGLIERTSVVEVKDVSSGRMTAEGRGKLGVCSVCWDVMKQGGGMCAGLRRRVGG